MTEDKQEILSNLYTQRAGLSLISQLKDEADGITSKAKRDVDDQARTLGKGNPEYMLLSDSDCHRLLKNNREQELLYSNNTDARGRNNDFPKRKMILAIISGIIFVIGIILTAVGFIDTENLGVLIAAGACVAFYGFLSFIIFLVRFISAYKNYKTSSQNIQYMNSHNASVNAKWDVFSKLIFANRKQFNSERQKIDRDRKTKIDALKSRSDCIYEILKKCFATFLDERDWKHIDLLIFYFETGRAETMREALQLVDKEIQVKNIIGAINNAATVICNTIKTGFASLERTLNDGFDKINNSLEDIKFIQIAQLNQAVMTNALLSKAATSCEQLANDVSHMRTYS